MHGGRLAGGALAQGVGLHPAVADVHQLHARHAGALHQGGEGGGRGRGLRAAGRAGQQHQEQ